MCVCMGKRLFLSFVSLVNMNSKSEKRVRAEDSMGPRGFDKTLKCNKNSNELISPT